MSREKLRAISRNNIRETFRGPGGKKLSGTEKRLSCINVLEMGSRHFIRPIQ